MTLKVTDNHYGRLL